jgi:hypothetical protein
MCRRDAGKKRPWSAEGATGTWEVEGDDAPDAKRIAGTKLHAFVAIR